MGFLNRFVADELPAMRSLLWRLSEPLSDDVSSTSTSETLTHTARLVDVFSVQGGHSNQRGLIAQVNPTNNEPPPNSPTFSDYSDRCVRSRIIVVLLVEIK